MVKYLEVFIFEYKYYQVIYQINNNNFKKSDFKSHFNELQRNVCQIYIHISTVIMNLKPNKIGYCFHNKYSFLNISVNHLHKSSHLCYKMYKINNINLYMGLNIEIKICTKIITIRRPFQFPQVGTTQKKSYNLISYTKTRTNLLRQKITSILT